MLAVIESNKLIWSIKLTINSYAMPDLNRLKISRSSNTNWWIMSDTALLGVVNVFTALLTYFEKIEPWADVIVIHTHTQLNTASRQCHEKITWISWLFILNVHKHTLYATFKNKLLIHIIVKLNFLNVHCILTCSVHFLFHGCGVPQYTCVMDVFRRREEEKHVD